MTLANVRDWLKSLNSAEHYYIGKLDNKQEKSLGVYQRDAGTYNMALGGPSCNKSQVKRITILLHWNKNANETEIAGQELYEKIITTLRPEIGGHHVHCIIMQHAEAVDVGTDEHGVYERVIQLDIYYERR